MTGATAFYEVYEALKRWEKKYPDCAEQYTIICHGRAGCPSKSQVKYMKGCTIKYSRLAGTLEISNVNRRIKPIVNLCQTALFVVKGAKITESKEEALANAKKRLTARRVLRGR